MKRTVCALLVCAAPVIDTSAASAQSATPADPSGYRVVHGWPTLRDGSMLGQATGVGVDSRDDVWVFHRAGRVWTEPFPTDPIASPTIAVFDGRTGRLLREWGENRFMMPHGLTIDRDDNVWVTDVALHQVLKFAPDGTLLLSLGERGVSGSDASHFDQPTDVAVAADGSFYVSDGYENTRVMKFSRDGRFLFQWGNKGVGPGQFDLPHAIALDESGRVYVADRSNARVQVFETDGRFVAEWKGDTLGRPYSVAAAADGSIFTVDGGDQPPTPPDRSGAVHLDRDGNVLARFGRFGNYDGQFWLAHDVATDSRGAVYIVDAWGQRIQKFVSAADEAAVVATVQRFLDALNAKDTTALKSVLTPDGRFAVVVPGPDSVVTRGSTHAQFIARIGVDTKQLLERMWDPTVLVEGPFATLWAPYDFHIDGELSHCGTDVFTLARMPGGWRITGASYTVIPTGCRPSPLGPPQP